MRKREMKEREIKESQTERARVGFLPEETSFFRDGGRNPEETWKKLEETVRNGRKWKKPTIPALIQQ